MALPAKNGYFPGEKSVFRKHILPEPGEGWHVSGYIPGLPGRPAVQIMLIFF